MGGHANMPTNSVRVGDRQIEFEYVCCDFCGDDDETSIVVGPDRSLGLPGTFRMVQCVRCGLIRQNPRPIASDIDAYYPATYEPFSTALAIDDEPSLLRRLDRRYGMRKRRKLIEVFQPGGRLLDVGCATGVFLFEMARTGRWSVEGIEPNDRAAAYANERHRLAIHHGSIDDAPYDDAQFDVVTLWNVLEHLHSPVTALHRIANWLKPGGWLVFSLPNYESFERKLFGDRWFVWELPRHLFIFPRAVVDAVCRSTGFEIVRSECLSASYFSFALSMRQLYQADEPPPFWYQPTMRIFESLVGRMLAAPTFYMISRLRQATIVTYVAKKL
jgi:SAM-dependent methyltransferase